MSSLTEKVILALTREAVEAVPTPENAKNWPTRRDALQIGELIVDRIWPTASPAKPWNYMGVKVKGISIDDLVDREKIWQTALWVLSSKVSPLEAKSEPAIEQALDQIIATK